jgi:hypothetical protein
MASHIYLVPMRFFVFNFEVFPTVIVQTQVFWVVTP